MTLNNNQWIFCYVLRFTSSFSCYRIENTRLLSETEKYAVRVHDLLLSSLWVSCTGSTSDWCALQEALYKCINTIQYNDLVIRWSSCNRLWQIKDEKNYISRTLYRLQHLAQSFILAISIAPLQVLYHSEALPTTARILYRSFTPKRTGNCR